jgi:riboflavin biosynthesis pyrimidine reductase
LRCPKTLINTSICAATLQLLAARGIGSVMLEGGSRLITSYVDGTTNPDPRCRRRGSQIAGSGGGGVEEDMRSGGMAHALQLHNPVYTPCGADIWIEAEVRYVH